MTTRAETVLEPAPHRILVIEDSVADFVLIQRVLRQHGVAAACHRVDSWPALEAALDEGGWNIVLADYNVPGMDFEARVRRIRDREPELPLILVSSSIGDARAVEVLKMGVVDFVLKDELVRLPTAVARALRENAERIERKRIEVQLHESRELLSNIISSSVTSIYALDPEQRITLANPAFLELVGRTEAEVIGRDVADVLGASEAAVIRKAHDALLATGRPVQLERSLHDARGDERILASAKFPLRDTDGQIVGVGVVAHDLTSQRLAERELDRYRQHLELLVAERTAELKLNEARLELILASTADGVVGVDSGCGVTFSNAAANELLGYDPGGLIGRNFHETVHHSRDDVSPHPLDECPVIQTLRTGATLRIERDALRQRNGHALPVSMSTRPMKDEDGRIIGAVVVFSDSTLRQQTEEAHELARASAERLARVKSEFLANMSHEIRTPLNGVLGLAQLGQQGSAGMPELGAYFDRILDSGRLLLGIINDILDFSKIEAGKLKIEAEPMDPGAVLANAVTLMQPQADARTIRLAVLQDGSLPAVCLGDALRTSQVLINLLSNAVKFTQQGTVTGSARLEDGWLCYKVEDTGIGMSEAQLAQVFTAFEQADGSMTRRFGGTGLGLTITRRLVELMHGEIAVRSEPGRGSIFEVRLPYVASNAATPPSQLPLAPARAGGERLHRLRLLVADDNPISQMVIARMLTNEGADVTVVDNGELAVHEVARNPAGWNAVLMDVQMPVMDGLEATRRIVALAPQLPVIGQTADALREDRDLCLAAGMVDQITKPVDHETLVAVVQLHVTAGAKAAPAH